MKPFRDAKIDFKETSSPTDFDTPLFGHSLIGRNGDPQSKIDAFTRLMVNGLGDRVDLAFFKFCYVDIVAETNIDDVFSCYALRRAELENKFPRVRFLTVTAPLKSDPVGLSATVQRMMGRTIRSEADNIRRNAFNARLREKYEHSLFDLADCEATDPARPSLRPEYTNDGGHLNALGRKIIGRKFLSALIKEIEKIPLPPIDPNRRGEIV
ncbi:MAG: SGNH/GDSL hydrolase family protein [Spirochaetales bacterium]|nr:MAG: SGNH/GDSL hydrolase family protein [Spirochaetales bacterium]